MDNLGQLFVQIFVVVIVIGIAHSLWRTTRAYGGLIGGALKWIGLGIVLFALEALGRVLGSLSFVTSVAGRSGPLVHDALLLLGLTFSAIGFSKLTKIAK